MNLFCKPYEQNQACSNYAMAKESCVKAGYDAWFFPREQMSKAILSVLWHGEGKAACRQAVSAIVVVDAMDDGCNFLQVIWNWTYWSRTGMIQLDTSKIRIIHQINVE